MEVPNPVMLNVNEILGNLMSENKRLLNDLLFANKLLFDLKTHLIKINSKYETTIDCEDKQTFNAFIRQLDEWRDKTLDKVLANTGSGQQTTPVIDTNVTKQRLMATKSGLVGQTSSQMLINSMNKTIDSMNASKMSPQVCLLGVQSTDTTGVKPICLVLNTTPVLPDKPANTGPDLFKKREYQRVYQIPDPKSEPNSVLLLKRDNFDPRSGLYICPNPSCRNGYRTDKLLYQHFLYKHDGKYRKYSLKSYKSERKIPESASVQAIKANIYPSIAKQIKSKTLANNVNESTSESGVALVANKPETSKQNIAAKPKTVTTLARLNPKSITDKVLKTMSQSVVNLPKSATVRAMKAKRLKGRIVDNSKHLDAITGKFLCPIPDCRMSFETNEEFRTHVRVIHKYKVILCPHTGCGKFFKSQTYLKDHLLGHSDDRPFGCTRDGCDARFKNERYLQKHVNSYHSDHMPYTCDECDKHFKTTGGLTNHKRLHRNEDFCCPYDGCDQKYRSFEKLRNHKIIVHKEIPKGRIVRPIPDPKSDPNSKLLLRLNNFDEKSQQFLCPNPSCGKPFKGYSNLCKHFSIAHTQRTFSCPYIGCGKVFRARRHVKRHQYVHSDDRPYGCPHDGCGKRFKTRKDLKNHSMVHSNVRPFECTVCKKAFKSKTFLQTHELRHKNIFKYFKCNYKDCGQRFRSFLPLKKHKVEKHNEQCLTYGCEWPGCEFMGYTPSQLAGHRLIHTGERPFPCQWPGCDKRFRIKSGLHCHHVYHANQKPYACHWPGCDFRSNNPYNVRQHLKAIHKSTDNNIKVLKVLT